MTAPGSAVHSGRTGLILMARVLGYSMSLPTKSREGREGLWAGGKDAWLWPVP